MLSVGINDARICEYEKGVREPNLITLLAYSYLVGIHVDDLIDDGVDLPAQIRIKRQTAEASYFARLTLPAPSCELNYPMQFFAASMNVQRI